MWGIKYRKQQTRMFSPIYVDGTIKTPEDWEKFEPPDPQETIDGIISVEKQLKKIKEDLFLWGGVNGIFYRFLRMRGLANGLMDFHFKERAKMATQILDMLHKFNMAVIPTLIDAGIEACLHDDDFAFLEEPTANLDSYPLFHVL